jgi:hypothetical protein
MSSVDTAFTFEQVAHSARTGVLRLGLYPGEPLRIPQSCRHLRVLSGAAWLTHCGHDLVLEQGESAQLRRCKEPAIISGLNNIALFFAVW